jgi:hypothetical protein
MTEEKRCLSRWDRFTDSAFLREIAEDYDYVSGARETYDRLMEIASALSETVTTADYEEVLADHRRLVREIDVILNGEEGAARQASLCDLIPQIKELVEGE